MLKILLSSLTIWLMVSVFMRTCVHMVRTLCVCMCMYIYLVLYTFSFTASVDGSP